MSHQHGNGCLCGSVDGDAASVILRALRQRLPNIPDPDATFEDPYHDSAAFCWQVDGKPALAISGNVYGTLWVTGGGPSCFCKLFLAREDADVMALTTRFANAGVPMKSEEVVP